MMDEESAVVTYRADRGEPRGAYKKNTHQEGQGDCVACNQCVAVCPMGIDIRNGQQLECITCALCIDACDDVMAKVNQPAGLIAYASIAGEARRQQGENVGIRMARARVLFYFLLWAGVGMIMLISLLSRVDLDINVLRDRNPLFVALSDGRIQNGYTFKILNKSSKTRLLILSIEGLPGARLKVVGSENITDTATPYFTVESDRVRSYRLFVSAPKEILSASSTDIRFVLTDWNTRNRVHYDAVFRGPEK